MTADPAADQAAMRAVVGYVTAMRAGEDAAASAIAREAHDWHRLFIVSAAFLHQALDQLDDRGLDVDRWITGFALCVEGGEP